MSRDSCPHCGAFYFEKLGRQPDGTTHYFCDFCGLVIRERDGRFVEKPLGVAAR